MKDGAHAVCALTFVRGHTDASSGTELPRRQLGNSWNSELFHCPDPDGPLCHANGPYPLSAAPGPLGTHHGIWAFLQVQMKAMVGKDLEGEAGGTAPESKLCV